jgi:hypothetical protein
VDTRRIISTEQATESQARRCHAIAFSTMPRPIVGVFTTPLAPCAGSLRTRHWPCGDNARRLRPGMAQNSGKPLHRLPREDSISLVVQLRRDHYGVPRQDAIAQSVSPSRRVTQDRIVNIQPQHSCWSTFHGPNARCFDSEKPGIQGDGGTSSSLRKPGHSEQVSGRTRSHPPAAGRATDEK